MDCKSTMAGIWGLDARYTGRTLLSERADERQSVVRTEDGKEERKSKGPQSFGNKGRNFAKFAGREK